MVCSPPGSSIHGIFQARVLEWGAIAFSTPTMGRGLFWAPMDPWEEAEPREAERREPPTRGGPGNACAAVFLAQKLKGAKSKRNRYAVVSPGSAETLLCPPALWQDVTTEGSLARAVPARGTS